MQPSVPLLKKGRSRPVALMVRAPDSKSGCWGFESLLACYQGIMLEKAIQFLKDVRNEVKRVTWPSRKEAMGGTGVVLITVFLIAIFLGLVDTLLSKIVESLIRV